MIPSQIGAVLITGAGRGIGAATAEIFFRNGFNVVMVARTATELAGTAEDISGGENNRILHLAGDIGDEGFVGNVFAQATDRFGPIQVLINNAAILLSKEFAAHTSQEWDEVQRINVRGPFLCARAFFRQFERRDPAQTRVILNIGSLGGIQNTTKFAGLSSYVVSKYALTGLTEALAVEGKRFGIHVFGIARRRGYRYAQEMRNRVESRRDTAGYRSHRIRPCELSVVRPADGDDDPIGYKLMKHVSITRRMTFCASHRLHSVELTEEQNRTVFGKCNNANGHGHNYVVEVTISGPVDPTSGIVFDMSVLKSVMRDTIKRELDHKNLNLDVPAFKTLNPTAENIAMVIWSMLESRLPKGMLTEVHLIETENNSVRIRA